MATVDYVYQYSLKLIRKNQAGGLSSSDFDYMWNGEQTSYQSDLLGRYQKYQRQGTPTGLAQISTIMTKLLPFIKNTSVPIIAGVATKPADFQYELAVRVGNEPVIHITHNQKTNVNDSVIDTPSAANGSYFTVEYGDDYNLLPAVTGTLDIDYIAQVTDVHWGYTFDGNNRQVYSAGLSTDPLWDNSSCREITERMLKKIGVAFSSQDFENFGQSIINTGQ